MDIGPACSFGNWTCGWMHCSSWWVNLRDFVDTKHKKSNLKEQNPSCETNSSSASQKLPKFCRIKNFITVVIGLRYHPTFLRRGSLSFWNLCLGLPSWLSPSGFVTKILYALLFLLTHQLCSAHPTLHLIILTISREQYKFKLLEPANMHIPTSSCHFRSLSFKYSPRHPLFKHPHVMFIL
jgi:hypothetical protein